MYSTKWLVLLLLVLSLSALPFTDICSAGPSKLFHSKANGYSLAMPEEWKQVPDSVLNNIMSASLTEDFRNTFEFETAFAKEWVDEMLIYPCLLIQIIKYPNNRQVTKDDFSSFIEVITGLDVVDDIKEGVAKYAHADKRGMISDVTVSNVSVDRQNMICKYTLESETETAGSVKGMAVGHFGRFAVIQLMFYCQKSDWSRFEKDRKLIFDSFRFDSGMQYDEPLATDPVGSPRPSLSWFQAFGRGLVYGLLGVAIAVIVFLWRRLRAYLGR